MFNQIKELLLAKAKQNGLKLKEDEEQQLSELAKEIHDKIKKGYMLEDYEYLLHHVETNDKGKEVLHHCYVYDHIGNLFQQKHLFIKKNKIYLDNKEIKKGNFHVIVGLEPTQEVAWSDEMAEDHDIVPKKMKCGMTLKEKSKTW